MGLDEGEWIHGGEPYGGEPYGGEPYGGEPYGGEPYGGEPDDDWAGEPWPAGPVGLGRRGNGGVPGFSVRVAIVVAAVAGVVALSVVKEVAAARATPSASASTPVSAGSGGSLPGLPGNGRLQITLTGRVLAVSGRSITIGGDGPSVTAAVTGATKITGTAGGIGGVRVGDEVSAQITGNGAKLTATAIQDPA